MDSVFFLPFFLYFEPGFSMIGVKASYMPFPFENRLDRWKIAPETGYLRMNILRYQQNLYFGNFTRKRMGTPAIY